MEADCESIMKNQLDEMEDVRMDGSKRLLPIGIQDFEKLRTAGNLYVDKTEYIYRLVETRTPYFLSRPRRFGKSLLLSTMKAYWEGKKELFQGLRIEELKKDEIWEAYPVFYFDFNHIKQEVPRL